MIYTDAMFREILAKELDKLDNIFSASTIRAGLIQSNLLEAALSAMRHIHNIDNIELDKLRAINVELREALKTLTMMARTSGGVAGRDNELCAACDRAETAIEKTEAEASDRLSTNLKKEK